MQNIFIEADMLNGANENNPDKVNEKQEGDTSKIKNPSYPIIILEKIRNHDGKTEKPRARGMSFSGIKPSTTTRLQIPTNTTIRRTKASSSDPLLLSSKDESPPTENTTPSKEQSLTESRELAKRKCRLEHERRSQQLKEVQQKREERLAKEREEKRELEKNEKKKQLLEKLLKSPVVNQPPDKQIISWETACKLTALSMLLGASIWSVPMVSKNLATIAIGYGYTSVAERIQADIGKRALCSPSILGCISIFLNIKTPGILLLLFTTGISTGCSYKEGNIYPGLLGTAGVILYAASYSFLRSESEPKQNTSIRPS